MTRATSATRTFSGNDDAAEFVAARLELAIQQTLAAHSPEPAREAFVELSRFDHELPHDQPSPGRTPAFLTLASWLNSVLPLLAGRPERVNDVLDRLPPDSGYPASTQPFPPEAGHSDQLWSYVAGQPDRDVLPSLVWLLAAIVTLHGDGDPAWPRRCAERGAAAQTGPPHPSRGRRGR